MFKTKKHSYNKVLDQCINKSCSVNFYLKDHCNNTNKHHSEDEDVKIAPIVSFIELLNTNGQQSPHLLKILLDSGTSSAVASSKGIQHLQYEQAEIESFSTVAGQLGAKNVQNSN